MKKVILMDECQFVLNIFQNLNILFTFQRTSYEDFVEQPDISGASDDNYDAEYVPSSKVRGQYGSRRGSRVRGRRGRPGRPAKSQRER